MDLNHPESYYSELSDDRLRIVANALLDIRDVTIREMMSEYDDNYTRETAVFGRSRNMLIDMARTKKYDWMSLKHAGMDVTFNIDRVPCRFFRDDSNNPEKAGFFKRNDADDLFGVDDQQPVLWRFVVEKALAEHDEDRVYFAGYNVYQEKIAEWMYKASSPFLHSTDQNTPASTEIPSASVDVREKRRSAGDDGDVKTGTDK